MDNDDDDYVLLEALERDKHQQTEIYDLFTGVIFGGIAMALTWVVVILLATWLTGCTLVIQPHSKEDELAKVDAQIGELMRQRAVLLEQLDAGSTKNTRNLPLTQEELEEMEGVERENP